MARKITNRKSPEQRREQARELQSSIAGQVEELRNSQEWQRFLGMASSFHQYSLNNLLLILAQNPAATRVAGFRQWQAKGRQVRKGGKAVKIFGFAQKKVRDDDSNSDETAERDQDGEKVVTYHPVLSVFDISQTDPIDGEDATTPAPRLTGDDPSGIYDTTACYLTDRGWRVERADLGGRANGTTDPTNRRVVIEADLAPAQAAKTILHEAAHVLLHAEASRAEYIEHRGIFEIEAESVAYVLAGLLGMDTSTYSIGYLADWSDGDITMIKNTAEAVITTVHRLAGALIEPAEVGAA